MELEPDVSTGRKGDWIQLVSGEPFWPLDPRPEEIHIGDIAHALSMQCRFGGHSTRLYTVAEHSVIVSRLVPPEHALWGLLHDAAEAYLVDLPRPVKRHMLEYREAEHALMGAICARFGLGLFVPEAVKRADNHALFLERRAVMAKSRIPWNPVDDGSDHGLPSLRIHCWYPREAKREFLDRFAELTETIAGERHASHV